MRQAGSAEALIVLANHVERFTLVPAIVGVTDEEFFWEPVDGAWGVRRRSEVRTRDPIGDGDFVLDFDAAIGRSAPGATAHPPTTVGWNLAHILSIEALPSFRFLGGGQPSGDYPALAVPGSATEATRRLGDAWRRTIAALTKATGEQLSEAWDTPFGPTNALDHVAMMINEVSHHAAQASFLRQLYRGQA